MDAEKPEVPDGVCLIPLRRRDGSVKAWALVDASDYADVNRWRWFQMIGYAARNRKSPERGLILMHRYLLGLGRGDKRQIDHINRNRLDNRRANLRIVTLAQNRQNVTSYGRSRFRGVHWNKGKWQVQVNFQGQKHYGGRFDDEAAAGVAAAAIRARLMPYAAEA